MESLGDVLKRMPRPPGPDRSRSSGRGGGIVECPMCGGAGYLRADVPVEDARFGELIACACTVDEQRGRRLKLLEAASNLGPLRTKTFANFLIDRSVRPQKNTPEAAFRAARTFADRSDRTEQERLDRPLREWLMLSGSHGTGKTHLAVAIANLRLDAGRPAIFIVVPDLLDRLRATFGPSSEVRYDELFEGARETELLILDDLGAQSSTPWAQEKLYQIINERYNRRLPTVITSNLRLDDMEPRLRSRIGDTSLGDNYWIQAPDVRLGVELEPQAQRPTRRR